MWRGLMLVALMVAAACVPDESINGEHEEALTREEWLQQCAPMAARCDPRVSFAKCFALRGDWNLGLGCCELAEEP